MEATIEENYKELRHLTQMYKNIENDSVENYIKFFKNLKISLEESSETKNSETKNSQFVVDHFQKLVSQNKKNLSGSTLTPLETNYQNLYIKTYGKEIHFLIDPLLNDIDDIIAFIYFYMLTYECFKDVPNISNNFIKMVINIEDVAIVNSNLYENVEKAATKLYDAFKDRSKIINLEIKKFEKPTSPSLKRSENVNNVEYMLLSTNGRIKSGDIKIQKTPHIRGGSIVNSGNIVNRGKALLEQIRIDNEKKDVHITIFLLRGIRTLSIETIKNLKKEDINIQVIANGADIFSNEDGSCPSNIRCGTKIREKKDTERKEIFNDYLNFINMCDENKIKFFCFPLKRADRPFTVQFIKEIKEVETIDLLVSSVHSAESLRTCLIELREALPENIQQYCFPDTEDAIVKDSDAYKQYGSFLIDLLSVMTVPLQSELKIRTLIMFEETITNTYKTMSDIQKYSDEELTFVLTQEELPKIYKHSTDALELCYGYSVGGESHRVNSKIEEKDKKSFEELQLKYKIEYNSSTNPPSNENDLLPIPDFEINKTEKLEIYSLFLSKTPATLEGTRGGFYIPVPTNSDRDLINPEIAILSNEARITEEKNIYYAGVGPIITNNKIVNTDREKKERSLNINEIKQIENEDFAIITDRNDLYTGGSIGPNGVLLNSSGGKYGKFRMNTFYINDKMTRELMSDYTKFRDANKDLIFIVYLNKLKDNKTKGGYEKIIKEMSSFYDYCIDKHIGPDKSKPAPLTGLTDFIGLQIKSRCQTWVRKIKGDTNLKLTAHNTIPVPHFQTFFYLDEKGEKIYTDHLNKYFESINVKITAENEKIPDTTKHKPLLIIADSVSNYKNSYKEMLYFFTRFMRVGYGTIYPLQITNGTNISLTEIDPLFNGNAFVNLDETLQTRFGGPLDTYEESKSKKYEYKVTFLESEQTPEAKTLNIATYNVLNSKLNTNSTFAKLVLKKEDIDIYNETIEKVNMLALKPLNTELENGENFLTKYNIIRELYIILQIYDMYIKKYVITLQEVTPDFCKKIVDYLTLMNGNKPIDYYYCPGTSEFTKYMGIMIISPFKIETPNHFFCNQKSIMTEKKTGFIISSYEVTGSVNETINLKETSLDVKETSEDVKEPSKHVRQSIHKIKNIPIGNKYFDYNPVILCKINGITVMTSHYPANDAKTDVFTTNINYCLEKLGIQTGKKIFTCDFNNNIYFTKPELRENFEKNSKLICPTEKTAYDDVEPQQSMRLLNDNTNIYTTMTDGFYFNNVDYVLGSKKESPLDLIIKDRVLDETTYINFDIKNIKDNSFKSETEQLRKLNLVYVLYKMKENYGDIEKYMTVNERGNYSFKEHSINISDLKELLNYVKQMIDPINEQIDKNIMINKKILLTNTGFVYSFIDDIKPYTNRVLNVDEKIEIVGKIFSSEVPEVASQLDVEKQSFSVMKQLMSEINKLIGNIPDSDPNNKRFNDVFNVINTGGYNTIQLLYGITIKNLEEEETKAREKMLKILEDTYLPMVKPFHLNKKFKDYKILNAKSIDGIWSNFDVTVENKTALFPESEYLHHVIFNDTRVPSNLQVTSDELTTDTYPINESKTKSIDLKDIGYSYFSLESIEGMKGNKYILNIQPDNLRKEPLKYDYTQNKIIEIYGPNLINQFSDHICVKLELTMNESSTLPPLNTSQSYSKSNTTQPALAGLNNLGSRPGSNNLGSTPGSNTNSIAAPPKKPPARMVLAKSAVNGAKIAANTIASIFTSTGGYTKKHKYIKSKTNKVKIGKTLKPKKQKRKKTYKRLFRR